MAIGSVRRFQYWDPAAQLRRSPDGSEVFFEDGANIGYWSALPRTLLPYPDTLSPWDAISFSGQRAPGIARVEGGRRHRFDHKPSLGVTGEAPTWLGVDPGEITITLKIWTPEHWSDLQRLLPQILPPHTAKISPRAVDVAYPPLNVIGITQIYVLGVEVPHLLGPGDAVEIKIDAWEYMPLQAVVAQPPLPAAPDGPITGAIRAPPTKPSAGAGVAP